ncbi:thiamine diphosphokinase [Paenibacillus sp. CMAA1364]
MTHKRVIIFSGGHLHSDFLQEIQRNDFIIGADKGALFLIQHDIRPHLSVGDFDSISLQEKEIVSLHSERMIACDTYDKDLTDTELAFEMAIEQQPSGILLVGGTGTRLDHTLANIHLFYRALDEHIPFAILDTHNYMTMTNSTIEVKDLGYTYVSLLPMTTEVTGVTLQGFLYPLDNGTLQQGQSLAISNQLSNTIGNISIESGLLLVIQSKD